MLSRKLIIFFQIVVLISSIKVVCIIIRILIGLLFYFINSVLRTLINYICIVSLVSLLILIQNYSYLRFLLIIILIGGLAVYFLIFVSTINLSTYQIQLKKENFILKNFLIVRSRISRIRYIFYKFNDTIISFSFIDLQQKINYFELIILRPTQFGRIFHIHSYLVLSLIIILTIILFGLTGIIRQSYFFSTSNNLKYRSFKIFKS